MTLLDTIAFAEDLLPLILDGDKLLTIRKGQRHYAEILTVTDPAGNVQPFKIQVETQYQYPAKCIPDRHIEMDGFLDLEDMVEGMTRFYPDFTPETICTVVIFKKVACAESGA